MTILSRPHPEARLLLMGRGLRAFADGFVAILLPAYLLALGFIAFTTADCSWRLRC